MSPEYTTALTGVRPFLGKTKEKELSTDTWLRTQGMLEKFAASDMLKAKGVQLDSWMKLKIPSLMFSSVIDPICVLLDARYKEVLYNPTANKLIDQLLSEIADVVGRMPEVKHSPELQNMLRSGGMRRQIMVILNMTSMSVNFSWRQPLAKVTPPKTCLQAGPPRVCLNQTSTPRKPQIPQKMDDSELDQIRKARLEQLKAQGGAGGSSAGGSNQKQAEQQQQRQQQEAEARQQILNQILHPEAADRLGRIRLVKEQRAQDVENRLIMLAQSGQLRSKVTEAQLKELLAAVAENKEEEKIVVSRRKGWDDDDDDLLDL
ncbi:2-dehydropantoate 2-reductase [Colletotrichum truncatum]|uniref:2-dehydropantoate 2-reductase n=1 Tax=Colletotrichum truncatum TaxID=5467 RepID=A0ACC3Z1N5_COLTU